MSFSELPGDIHRIILSRNPSTLASSQRLNKTLAERAKMQFYREFCMRMPSKKEINQYVSTYPDKFATSSRDLFSGYYKHYLHTTSSNSIRYKTFMPHNGVITGANSGSFVIFYKLKGGVASEPKDSIEEYTRNNSLLLDLNSVYHISESRVRCLQINKNYPNDAVRSYLAFVDKEVFPISKDASLVDNLVNALEFYNYLIFSADILSLRPLDNAKITFYYRHWQLVAGSINLSEADIENIIETSKEIGEDTNVLLALIYEKFPVSEFAIPKT